MLKLKGKSRKGKARIATHGEIWVPVQGGKSVSCLGYKEGLLLQSVKTGYKRWMARENDKDFVAIDRVDPQGNSLLPDTFVDRKLSIDMEFK